MKTSIFFLLFILMDVSALGQNRTKHDADFGPDSIYGMNLGIARQYQWKIDLHSSQKKIGTVLVISGIPTALAGITVIAISQHNLNNMNSLNDLYKWEHQKTIGGIIFVAGITAIISGIVIRGMGNRHTNMYILKRNGLRISPYTTIKSTGLSLSYSFK